MAALIIRNISQLSLDEMDLFIQLSGIKDQTKSIRGKSPYVVQFMQALEENDIYGAKQLVSIPAIRNYLYEQIKIKTGCHVILHQDGESSPLFKFEKAYILSKLAQIEPNTHMSLLYMGGGHGGFVGLSNIKLLSGLEIDVIDELTAQLKNESITFDGIILHSCSSALFLKQFRPLLAEEGGMLSYCAEIGSSSNWETTLKWGFDRKSDNSFFSSDALAKPWENGDLGTTTGVISTKNSNLLMDLDKSNRGLPDYVDAEGGDIQRELVLCTIIQENGIETTMETDTEQFNDVVAMERFNDLIGINSESSYKPR